MRYEQFLENEIYHVSLSGSGERVLFLDKEDYARFLFLITHLQSPTQIYNITWYINRFIKKGTFTPTDERPKLIIKERHIELLAFSLLPTQFDLIVKNLEEGILSVYMQRILTGYSKYFNKKYNKHGHVFSGPFRATKIKNNDELLKLSASLHKSKGENEWSSYQDLIEINRWGELLQTESILKHFKNQAQYKQFVEQNTKEKAEKAQIKPL